MRKASMKVVNANSNSSLHNSRTNPPKYLIEDENFKENYYEQIHTDDEFRKLAELKYLSTKNQKMQERQKVALIKETVLNLEEHHTEQDVKKLFEKLNREYGGHYITELSIHRDEGHFEKDGIPYYPTKHILKKNDSWYIVPLEKFLDKDFKPKKEDFSEKVNINEFKKVKNIHAHVKFSMFDLNTGLTGRMTKGQVSKRLKVVADELKLAYKPEQKISSGKAIKTIKDEHDLNRRSLIQKLYLKQENSELQEENQTLQYNFREYQKRITAIENADKEQKKQLHRLNTSVKKKEATVELLESKIQELETKVFSKKYLVDNAPATNAEIVEYLEQEVENRDITVARLEAEKEEQQQIEKNRFDEYRKQVDAEYRKKIEELKNQEPKVQKVEKIVEIENPETQKELSEARESVSTLEKENDTLKSDLSSYKQDMSDLEAENKELKEQEPQIKEVEKIVPADNTELKKQIAEYANIKLFKNSEEKMPQKFKLFDFVKKLIDSIQQWKEAYFKQEKELKELKNSLSKQQKEIQESEELEVTENTTSEFQKMLEKMKRENAQNSEQKLK